MLRFTRYFLIVFTSVNQAENNYCVDLETLISNFDSYKNGPSYISYYYLANFCESYFYEPSESSECNDYYDYNDWIANKDLMCTDFTYYDFTYNYDEEDRDIFTSVNDYFGSRNLNNDNPKNDNAVKKVYSMCYEHGANVATHKPSLSNRLVSKFLDNLKIPEKIKKTK